MASISRKDIRGINHKNCSLMTAIYDNEYLLFKVAGLGVERREIIDQFKDHMNSGSLVVVEKGTSLCLVTRLFKINNREFTCYSESNPQAFYELEVRTHGISKRYIQGNLGWLSYKKLLKYQVEAKLLYQRTYEGILMN